MHISTLKFVVRSTYQNGLKALFMKLKYIWLWSPLGGVLKDFKIVFTRKLALGIYDNHGENIIGVEKVV